jgi:hypothetical protein
MPGAEPITSIEVAELQTREGDFHNVEVDVYHGWLEVEDDTRTRWIPRDIVAEIFELK